MSPLMLAALVALVALLVPSVRRRVTGAVQAVTGRISGPA